MLPFLASFELLVLEFPTFELLSSLELLTSLVVAIRAGMTAVMASGMTAVMGGVSRGYVGTRGSTSVASYG